MLGAWFGAFNGGDHGETTHFESPENGYGRKDNEWKRLVFAVTVASLCIVVFFAVVLYYVYFVLYSNRLRQAERRPRRRGLRISQARRFTRRGANRHFFPSPGKGLCRAVVDSLPIFVYKPENFEGGLSCAVCLCEFQENEKARNLPSCNHNFHVDCIDMWFSSHSTCPLCRASVEELDRRQMEVSVTAEEEADDKALTNSSTGSSAQAAERGKNDECPNMHFNGEESSEIEVRIIINCCGHTHQ